MLNFDDIKSLKIRRLYAKNSPAVDFREYKKGFYYFGDCRPGAIIEKNRPGLRGLGISDARINIIQPVAENEGHFDAINTWDNSFLSFGMLQWTLGTGSNPGELPALLSFIENENPELFANYFGIYGINTLIIESDRAGFLVFDGEILDSSSKKLKMTDERWPYLFWLAGQNLDLQLLQIKYATSRIDDLLMLRFRYRDAKVSLIDIVSSEYGFALILDHHVNRPGYVEGCIDKTLSALEQEPDFPEVKNWTTREETRFLWEYKENRIVYGRRPMTNAKTRSESIISYLDSGFLSAERGSFSISEDNAAKCLII